MCAARPGAPPAALHLGPGTACGWPLATDGRLRLSTSPTGHPATEFQGVPSSLSWCLQARSGDPTGPRALCAAPCLHAAGGWSAAAGLEAAAPAQANNRERRGASSWLQCLPRASPAYCPCRLWATWVGCRGCYLGASYWERSLQMSRITGYVVGLSHGRGIHSFAFRRSGFGSEPRLPTTQRSTHSATCTCERAGESSGDCDCL